ncbi:hypothetical protein BS50DRAFT_576030 [Corynespora cassiicola Philippines]|uniref:Uncharacterized protein n=1 Tax=Corynespora cassiicola Philippines TaxID=1448308 RepID=A0A2T2NGM8_CORCC|nr:hypothetical protein BS50DRAFT_576030 [Corynespora cassiicola Philippines]
MASKASGLLAGQHDSQKERAPPLKPIPATFPSYPPPTSASSTPPPAWTAAPNSPIPAHFLNLKRPTDVNLDTLALLNVSFAPESDFETLLASVPVPADAQSYLPPKTWLDPSDQSDLPRAEATSVTLLSNGRRAPERNDFHVRAKELFFNNEDAFSNLTRKPRGPKTQLRLAHFRKFWEGLDNMAYYWDDSLDEYLPPNPDAVDHSPDKSLDDPSASANGQAQDPAVQPETGPTTKLSPNSGSPNREEPRKKAKTEAVCNETITLPVNSLGFGGATVPARHPTAVPSQVLPARGAPPKAPWAINMEPQKPLDSSRGTYRGYRIGNGAEMPDQYRLDTVRSFLEPIAWAFGITFVPHRRPPVLLLEHIRFPVRMNTVGWRGPADRMKARQGWMEGPVLGVQCRPDTSFGSTGNLEAESVLDVVRELGGLLLLAQERARQGKTEKRGGEGKWWTTKPRWGGGPGGEVGEARGASDAPSADAAPKPDEKPSGRSRMGSTKERRRPTPAEIWKTLRPGNPLWDPKIVYEAIGKDSHSDWDDIFMVSSLNHHISVLKLHVHSAYLQFITEGKFPESEPSDPNWCSPTLHRTRWFDLFSIEDRSEAMRGLWGITAYLLRAQPKEEADVDMKGSS